VSAAPNDPEHRSLARRSTSVGSTERIGESLAPHLRVGDVISLTGPLGAGKTRLVAGLARGLGSRSRVRSPSFTLVNEYRGRVLLLHLDLYRVEPWDSVSLGLEEELERGALVAEWGEKLPSSLRADCLEVGFEIVSDHERSLTACASRGRGLELLGAWGGLGAEESEARR